MAKEITEEVKPIFASLGTASAVPGKGLAGLLDMVKTVLASKPVKDVTEGIPPNVMPAGAMAKGGAAGAGWLGKLLAASPGLAAGMVSAHGKPIARATQQTIDALPRSIQRIILGSKTERSVTPVKELEGALGNFDPMLGHVNVSSAAKNAPNVIGHEFTHDIVDKLYPDVFTWEGAYHKGIDPKTTDPIMKRIAELGQLDSYARTLRRQGVPEEALPFEVHANLMGDLVNLARGVPFPGSNTLDLVHPDVVNRLRYINRAATERLGDDRVRKALLTTSKPEASDTLLRDWIPYLVTTTPQHRVNVPKGIYAPRKTHTPEIEQLFME